MSAFRGKTDIARQKCSRGTKKVLQFQRNVLNHLEREKRSFESKALIYLKGVELPKLHTSVRFPSPVPL
jgi:hypothetical protein